jgi:hypothetical protein
MSSSIEELPTNRADIASGMGVASLSSRWDMGLERSKTKL